MGVDTNNSQFYGRSALDYHKEIDSIEDIKDIESAITKYVRPDAKNLIVESWKLLRKEADSGRESSQVG